MGVKGSVMDNDSKYIPYATIHIDGRQCFIVYDNSCQL